MRLNVRLNVNSQPESAESSESDQPAAAPEVPEVSAAAVAAVAPASAAAPQRLPDLAPAECAALLAQHFPAVFGKEVHRPLKLRIAADIQQQLPNTFTKRALSAFLHRHTTGTPYLKALANEPNRYDLSGAAAGEVSAEHRQAAADEVQRRRAMQQQRRTGAIETQRKAELAQREADGKERAARARLLRAFETSTLTRANFCTLMGVADGELDTLLAQARDERQRHAAAQPPAAPRPNARPR
jgi:ProP effector